ncbi:ribonuclease domain-containing protein [Neisseria weaveri]|uniref:ribonuclease domain-containing protein n=1 Tax=Neisseria weaveri TaxID=28091 RepID=UPI001F2DEEC0|nr:ribonuclease domain-containing protein [Neisseria weaveri]
MSKREKRRVTKEEAEARIIRQMLRNVDEATAKADLFKRDDNIVSLMGAYLPKRDKHYQDSAYNSRYNAAYGSVLNHAFRYKHFGRTPEEINSYNRHVVTDIPKAIANVGISAYESAANLANGSAFPEDPAYVRIDRIGYGIPEYGNALETAGSLGLGAYTLGRGASSPNVTGTKSPSATGNRRYSVVDGEMAGGNKASKPITSSGKANAATVRGLNLDLKTAQAANEVVESLRTAGKLPSHYVTKNKAIQQGWKPGKPLSNYVKNGQIGGDIFENSTKILPFANGRVWYEADIGLNNTISRAKQTGTRILYSNDGLLYITNDHYKTVTKIGTWK